MQTKKILIIGSGSILTGELVKLWRERNSITIAYSGEHPQQTFEGEITYTNLNSLFGSQNIFSHVVIISAYIPESVNQDNLKLFNVNVLLTEKIVNFFASSRIIFCSSVSIYKPDNNCKITENDLVFPQNEYAVSKLWAEHIIKRSCHNYVIFRISSLVGQRMKQNTFIPQIIKQAKETQTITLFGNGQRRQNYIHVSDVAHMIDSSIGSVSLGLYLAVNPISYTNREVASAVCNLLPNISITFNGEDHSHGYSFNAKKTYEALNYVPDKNIEFMIRELLQ